LIASLQLLSVRLTPFYSIFLTKNYLKPKIGGIPALIERCQGGQIEEHTKFMLVTWVAMAQRKS